MITVERKLQITITEQFNWSWELPNSCVRIISDNLDENGLLTTVFEFLNRLCIDQVPFIRITIGTASGCIVKKDIEFSYEENTICGTMSLLGGIQRNSDQSFQANVIGGKGPYRYVWEYDPIYYSIVGSASSALLGLTLKPGMEPPNRHRVTLRAFDSLGCSLVETFDFAPCKPQAEDASAVLYRLPVGYASAPTFLYATDCDSGPVYSLAPQPFDKRAGNTLTGNSYLIDPRLLASMGAVGNPPEPSLINWDTLKIDNLPENVTYRVVDPGVVVFDGTNQVLVGNYNLSWSVEDRRGNQTNVGTIRLSIPDQPPVAPGSVVFLPLGMRIKCDSRVGDIYQFQLEDYIYADGVEVDWNSFKFIPVNDYIYFNPHKIQTEHGIITLDRNRTIKYEVLNVGVPFSDNVVFAIASMDGDICFVSEGAFVFTSTCTGCPEVIDINLCVACGGTVSFDIRDVVVGNLDPATFTLVDLSQVFDGVASIDNGVFSFTSSPEYKGDSKATFTVLDCDGNISRTGFIYIEINCVSEIVPSNGIAGNWTGSLPTEVDLYDLLTGADDTIRWEFGNFVSDEGLLTPPLPKFDIGDGTIYYEHGDRLGDSHLVTVDFMGEGSYADRSPSGTYTFCYTRGEGACRVKGSVNVIVSGVDEV